MQLYKRLHLLARQKNVHVLVIPHWRGRIANPLWNDQEFSPVIELASEAGWNEDWALQFLRRGYHLGFIGSSDDHYGRPGYGMADDTEAGYGDRLSFPFGRDRFNNPWGNDTQGSPVVAVISRENDRESIFEAISKRHCYVTSGPRIILDFRSDSHLMGDEFSSEEPPHFEASAETISPITALILKKDGQPIDIINPGEGSMAARLSYTERKDFKGHFYYIERPDQIPDVFRRELGELLTVVAREAFLSITIPSGFAVELLGDLPHERNGARLRIFLGDLCAGEFLVVNHAA